MTSNPTTPRARSLATVLLAALAVAGAIAAVPSAMGRSAETARTTGTLQLNGTLALVSIRAGVCPPGTRPSILCPARTGRGVVPGLGSVTESYTYMVDEVPPSCPGGGVKILGYPVRWVVAGKGEIHFALHELPECDSGAAFTADQSFTITGGTGIYAGASGSGTADRALSQTNEGAVGRETWTGTLTVPGLEFDVTPPTLSGAASKTVRAPRRATRVRVAFAVTARDETDGALPASCRPTSGSRFQIGRSVVTCSATDASGNAGIARFTITVERRR